MANIVRWVGLLGVGWAVACASEASAPAPAEEGKGVMAREQTCLKTYCEVMRETCVASIDECYSECGLMAYDSLYIDCLNVCNRRSCDDSCSSSLDDQCGRYRYEFSLPADANPAIASHCEAALVRDQRCGETLIPPHCDQFAHLERPEAADAYACIAALPCGADPEPCWPAATELGQKVCGRIDRCAGFECPPEIEQIMAALGGWLRDDVQAEALACFDHRSCENGVACFEAWLATVLPPS